MLFAQAQNASGLALCSHQNPHGNTFTNIPFLFGVQWIFLSSSLAATPFHPPPWVTKGR
jgi:hypothetical protein